MQLELEPRMQPLRSGVMLHEELALIAAVTGHDAVRLPHDIGPRASRAPALHYDSEREIRLFHEPSNIPRLL